MQSTLAAAMAETIKETAIAAAENLRRYVQPLLSFAVYLCAGIFFFTNLETKPCADPAAPLHTPDEITGDSGSGPDVPFGTPPPVECQSNCTVPWTPLDAIYFGVVTMSTVGYGDLSPATWYSQLFTIVYMFCGILAVFSQLTATVIDLFAPAFSFARRALTFVLPQPDTVVLAGNDQNDLMLHRKNSAIFYARRLLGPVLVLCAFQVVFAFAFAAIEPDWDFGIAIYHCLVTATTVGYGDVSIETDRGKICAIVHILVSVCALGAIVGDIDVARSERAAEMFRAKQLGQLFDRSRLEHLLADEKFNQDGGGIEKFEFVVGMLLEAEYVKQSDVDSYVTLFERADVTGDGKISSADIHHITAAFERMWPSHEMVHRALVRSSTVKLKAQKCNKVTPLSPESRARWSRARIEAKVSGGTLTAGPLDPASSRSLVQQVNDPAQSRPCAFTPLHSHAPALGRARPDQAGGGRVQQVNNPALGHAPALGRARPDQAGSGLVRRPRTSSKSMLILDPTAPCVAAAEEIQAVSRGTPSSSRTRWSRTGAKVSSGGVFSAAVMEPDASQRSFAELGGARSRVTP